MSDDKLLCIVDELSQEIESLIGFNEKIKNFGRVLENYEQINKMDTIGSLVKKNEIDSGS